MTVPSDFKEIVSLHRTFLETGGEEGRRGVFAGFDLSSADLSGCPLDGADLSEAVLSNASLDGAVLIGANLSKADLTGCSFRNADLRQARFEGAAGLNEAIWSGADLRDATFSSLPHVLSEHRIDETMKGPRTQLFALLGACAYTWLTVLTTSHADLITNTATTSLPIIQAEVPIAKFFLIVPILLLAIYVYFNFQVQRVWETLATLPATFPNGERIDNTTGIWLPLGIAWSHFHHSRAGRRPYMRAQDTLAALVTWGICPATLFVLWAAYLVRHDWLGIAVHSAFIGIGISLGIAFVRLARDTMALPKEGPMRVQAEETPKETSLAVDMLLWTAVPLAIAAVLINPITPLVTANISDQDVSVRPNDWSSDEPSLEVRGARLRSLDLRGLRGESAFLVNADLRNADLRGAFLSKAQLSGAKLDAICGRHLVLGGGILGGAIADGASFQFSDLTGANLWGVSLREADFLGAILDGALLSDADLSDASLSSARLNDASLRNATLTGALLNFAELRGADLSGASLDSANLWAADLAGADLGCMYILLGEWVVEEDCVDLVGAQLGHANLKGASLEGADLLGATLEAADLRFADLASVKNWSGIESVSEANIFGVKNPPEGFVEWAIGNGAVLIEDEGEWVDVLRSRRPSDALYRYEWNEVESIPAQGMTAGEMPVRPRADDFIAPALAFILVAIGSLMKLMQSRRAGRSWGTATTVDDAEPG